MLNLEDDQMQDHRHSTSDPGHYHSVDDPGHYHSHNDKLIQDLNYHDCECGGNCGRANGFSTKTESHSTGSKNTGISIDKETTRLSVTGVTSSYRHVSETRPKNMNVIYIMRVW